MTNYRNVMENLVEEIYEEVAPSLNCCTCDLCRADMIAFALNQLPPKYVVTDKGEVYSKMYVLRNQHRTDIMASLTKAAKLVQEKPRHQN